jgi:acetyl/propionyl-CoA carboxylase alpha subunit
VEKRKIKRLLVANRGEIALRIIRSARVLGLSTVAVYSEADADSPHVALADDARLIGPAEASKSYLNIDAIIAAARDAGADAVHPGYGFLSERPEFSQAVAHAGMVFVGPHPDVMARLGDKVAARLIAANAGVPVVPGIEGGGLADARAFAERAGYPVVVKAAAGGGGRGMRIVADVAHLEGALEASAREAMAAFGDGRVFVEKYLPRPRHIEVQIVGDERGNLAAYGERDCSIQRRYQKLVEESPAPGISDALRGRIIEAALKVASAAGYTSAGTVEFLVQGDDFYFLEVNARLQVEHPVTEMRFGCDLVAEQLRVAAGEKLAKPAPPRGHALECRIYAEDAARGFRPSAGEVVRLNLPSGPGVRIDTHLVPGLRISTHYDGLLGKLIAWAPTREEAQRRLLRALDEFVLLGVAHTGGFLRDVIGSGAFTRAELSTHLIDDHFAGWRPAEEGLDAALVAAALLAEGSARWDGAAGAAARRIERTPWAELRGFELWKRP